MSEDLKNKTVLEDQSSNVKSEVWRTGRQRLSLERSTTTRGLEIKESQEGFVHIKVEFERNYDKPSEGCSGGTASHCHV